MAKKQDLNYGVKSIRLGAIPSSGEFPETGATGNDVIVFDEVVVSSVSLTQDEDTTNDIYVENIPEVWKSLTSEKGARTFTFSNYGFNDSIKKLLGYEKDTTDPTKVIWKRKLDYVVPEMYLEVETLALEGYDAATYQYMPVKVSAVNTMALTRGDIASVEFSCQILANVKDGVIQDNERIIYPV